MNNQRLQSSPRMQQIQSYFQIVDKKEYQLQLKAKEAANFLRNCERELQKNAREKEEKTKKEISDLL